MVFIRLPFVVFSYKTDMCWVQIYALHGAKSSILNCKPVQEYSNPSLAIPNIYTITTFISLYNKNGETLVKKPQSNRIMSSRN